MCSFKRMSPPLNVTYRCKAITGLLMVLLLLPEANAIQTLVKLKALGEQPTVTTPQGNVRKLYDNSYALLISASEYVTVPGAGGWSRLPHTRTEVDRLAAVLQKQGFNIWRLSDATGAELRKTIREFISTYGNEPENRLLFFFSGHGYTKMKTDFGYLVPIDAADPNVSFSGFQLAAIPIAEMELVAKEIESRHVLFLFDSCFSGTIFSSRSVEEDPYKKEKQLEGRWRFLDGAARRPVRQFISAGGARETLPAKSIFLPILIDALEGNGPNTFNDRYITGKDLGSWIAQEVPTYGPNQHPESNTIRDPELSKGDFVFQFQGASTLDAPGPSSAAVANVAATSEKVAIDVLFGENKSSLNPKEVERVEDLAASLRSKNFKQILVTGIAETAVGTAPHAAKTVALTRAAAVKNLLVMYGVPDSKIVFQTSDTPAGVFPAERMRNRRVSIDVIDPSER
jgi:outer membrane protein OmpA-like peptidoglycan-associated protein